MDSKRTQRLTNRFRSERGISLIHVALLLFVMMGFSMFVTDFGVLWLARGQAQNAADAGALAGAIARGFDEVDDPPAVNGLAETSARAAVANHTVVGTVPTANVSWTCPPYVTGVKCVRVDVFRDGTNGSVELPTYFAAVFGIGSQRIKATATAQVANANATDCLRPFAVPDLFADFKPGYADNPENEYHHYQSKNPGRGTPLADPDSYVKPTDTDPGTGYTIEENYGTQVILKFGTPSVNDPISPGWYLPIDVPRADGTPSTGGARYRENIGSCNGIPVKKDDYLLTETGAKIGPTNMGIEDLIAQDPDAKWDPDTMRIIDSCVPGCGEYSPRVIALAVYDVEKFDYSMTHGDWSMCPSGGTCVQIVNFLAYFVDQIDKDGNVIGYLTREAGIWIGGGGTSGLNSESSFLPVISLIQ